MTTWKPGDVAIAYDRDWEFRVVRHLGEPAYWSAADGEWPAVSADSLDYRPLVVVDPESADDIDRLCDLIAEDVDWLALQAALREFANPTPPKPPHCDASLNIGGAHYPCEGDAGHTCAHGNSVADAIWRAT